MGRWAQRKRRGGGGPPPSPAAGTILVTDALFVSPNTVELQFDDDVDAGLFLASGLTVTTISGDVVATGVTAGGSNILDYTAAGFVDADTGDAWVLTQGDPAVVLPQSGTIS